MKTKILIIGGGAAGIMASFWAANENSEVTIMERNDKIGRKILATGNGRCNFTNVFATMENYHGENDKFPYSAFSQFEVYTTMAFFDSIGIKPKVEEEGKVFPASLQSSSMIEVFNYEIKKRKINLKLNMKVTKIEKKKEKFIIETNIGDEYSFDKVILTTGGKALPTSGSDGNGYNLAKSLGHNIIEPFPGIVQLHLEDKYSKEKSGVRIDGKAELYIDDKFIKSDKGDVLFTDYGISGPTILQLSRRAIYALRKGKKVEIKVNLFKDESKEEVYNYLNTRFTNLGDRSLKNSLIGYINKKLILPILKDTGLDSEKKVSELSKEEVNKLAEALVSWTFKVTDHQPWEFAQVTAGGIDTREIDSSTMESKIIEGLYFAGEIIDVDGDCGGYNLQWAWSSGYVAGLNASL